MPRGLPALALWLAALLPPMPALAQAPSTPEGLWLTASRDAVIQITQCGTDYCGAIAGMALLPADKEPVDWAGRSQCGLIIVLTSATAESGGWHGTVTDPRSGATYHAKLWLADANDLHLRGYLGLPIFGRTQTWTRYTGPIGTPECRLPQLVAASREPPPPDQPEPSGQAFFSK